MTGYLREVRPGVWKGTIYAGRNPTTGRDRQTTKTFEAKGPRAAARTWDEHVNKLRAKAKERAAAAGTVGGYAEEWLATMKAEHKSPATIYRDESIVRAIVDGLGHIRLIDLSVEDVERWYTTLRAEDIGRGAEPRYRTESTVAHYHRILHQILTTAERRQKLPVAPTRHAKAPKRPKPRPRPPETAVLLELLDAATPTVKVAAALAAKLGVRRGELMGLRWTDLAGDKVHIVRAVADVPGRRLEVKAPKTEGSVRTISVDAHTLAVLAVWRAGLEAECERRGGQLAPDAYIIPDIDMDGADGRTPRRPGWLSKAWHRHVVEHGYPEIRLHDLRHWSATLMIASGTAVPTVAKRLGHTKTSTTLDMYSGTVAGADETAAAALGALLP